MNGYEKRTMMKKKQVIEATFKLLNKENDISVDNITMDEIVKYSQVGKTTIFKYFGNKDNLIQEVSKHFLENMKESANNIILENKPFAETLIALTQNKINFFNKVNKKFYLDLMVYITKKDNEGLSIMMRQYIQESIGNLIDLFHRGRKEGKIDLKYSDEFLLLYFQAIIEGISNEKIYDKLLPYTSLWMELIIKGFASTNKN